MKEIGLTQNKVALVDDEDFEWLNQFKWCAKKDKNTFYAIRKIKNGKNWKSIFMHRVIINTPFGKQTDHKDTNGLNNQRYNLRVCTNSQNQRNTKPTKRASSIFKGIYWYRSRNKWRTTIMVDWKRKHLGYFKSEIEAAKAYDKAALKYFGEFARLNFPCL